jgi:hypothetical protein
MTGQRSNQLNYAPSRGNNFLNRFVSTAAEDSAKPTLLFRRQELFRTARTVSLSCRDGTPRDRTAAGVVFDPV